MKWTDKHGLERCDCAESHARIAELESALRDVNHWGIRYFGGDARWHSSVIGERIKSVLAALAPRTAGEPLPKLECGMGCGRTFCSPEGRDHHIDSREIKL